MKNNVQYHDFGYGKSEKCEINKLHLKCREDVKEYVFDVVKNAFVEGERVVQKFKIEIE